MKTTPASPSDQTVSSPENSPKIKNIQERLALFMKQPGVSEVLEWTFMYDKQSVADKTPYNKTFFDTIAGVSYERWQKREIAPRELVALTDAKFAAWIGEVMQMKNDLAASGALNPKTSIECEGLDFIALGIQAARPAIAIELEKASSMPLLSDEERQSLVAEVDHAQTLLYWEKISDNVEESIAALRLLCEEFAENGHLLDSDQKNRFLSLFDALADKVAGIFGSGIAIPEIRNFQKKTASKHDLTVKAFEKMKGVKLPKEAYMHLWQQYIDAMGFHQRVISSPSASSIYDGPNALEIPESSAYESKDLASVLQLMIHEIGAHYANQATSERNGFKIRGAKNIEKEEGLAVVLERLFEGESIADMKGAGYSFPYILAGELLSGEDRMDLTDLRQIMGGIAVPNKAKTAVNPRDLRIMRGYPLNGPWAQRKDSSYGRGTNRIVELITNGQCTLSDFYRGKFSIEDIASGRLDGLVPKESVVLPLLFPEMFLLLVAEGREALTHARFMAHLREKYENSFSPEEFERIEIIKGFSKLRTFVTMWRDLEKYLPSA